MTHVFRHSSVGMFRCTLYSLLNTCYYAQAHYSSVFINTIYIHQHHYNTLNSCFLFNKFFVMLRIEKKIRINKSTINRYLYLSIIQSKRISVNFFWSIDNVSVFLLWINRYICCWKITVIQIFIIFENYRFGFHEQWISLIDSTSVYLKLI